MDVTHPDQIHAAFEKAINDNDVDAMLDLYETDGVALDLEGGEVTGRAAMRASFEGMTAAFGHLEHTDRKLVVAGGVALLSATWTAEIALPDGAVTTATGVTAEVAVRRPDGTWRLVIDDPAFV